MESKFYDKTVDGYVFPVYTTCSLVCIEGYHVIGVSSLYCNESRQWDTDTGMIRCAKDPSKYPSCQSISLSLSLCTHADLYVCFCVSFLLFSLVFFILLSFYLIANCFVFLFLYFSYKHLLERWWKCWKHNLGKNECQKICAFKCGLH